MLLLSPTWKWRRPTSFFWRLTNKGFACLELSPIPRNSTVYKEGNCERGAIKTGGLEIYEGKLFMKPKLLLFLFIYSFFIIFICHLFDILKQDHHNNK